MWLLASESEKMFLLSNFAARLIIVGVGYVYPAYECFKAKEQPKASPEVLQDWLAYWLVIVLFTVVESFLDVLVFWLPLYNEMKVAFIVWLWHPRTQGGKYVYHNYMFPKFKKHEKDIDKFLDESKARASDAIQYYWGLAIIQCQQLLHQAVMFISQQSQPPQQGGQRYNVAARNAQEAAAGALLSDPPKED